MKGRVGARELKARLGRYLQAVRQGSTLVVTDRGEPVAELRPLGSNGSATDAGLAALEALGVLTRPARPRLAPFRPLRSSGRPLSEAIDEGRADRS
jgi:prevent-host-death family protein